MRKLAYLLSLCIGILFSSCDVNTQMTDSEPLAAVRIGDVKTGKWGYINKEGKYVINPQFDAAGSFSK